MKPGNSPQRMVSRKEEECTVHHIDIASMNKTSSGKRPDPFPFVLEELDSIRPTVKRMFGFTSVYLEEKLLFSLRDSIKQPGSNGMWLYTITEHLDSLAREFPELPRRQLWRSGKKAWVVLASRLAGFEEYAFKACELILKGDRRIGRVTRGRMSEPPA
jgi:hypothetical protein